MCFAFAGLWWQWCYYYYYYYYYNYDVYYYDVYRLIPGNIGKQTELVWRSTHSHDEVISWTFPSAKTSGFKEKLPNNKIKTIALHAISLNPRRGRDEKQSCSQTSWCHFCQNTGRAQESEQACCPITGDTYCQTTYDQTIHRVLLFFSLSSSISFGNSEDGKGWGHKGEFEKALKVP